VRNNARRNKLRYWIALGAGLLACMDAGAAWAQAATDKAAAEALFDEGRKLINKPDDPAAWAAACEKFDASVKRLPQIGAQIALASCYEKIGKTASAWAAFRTAATAASKANDKRQRFAEQQIAALDARLSKLVIRLETLDRPAALEVKCDGRALTPAELGSALPVDPGEHVVEASAPGRVSWWTRLSIAATPGIVEVPVPVLEKTSGARRTRRISTYVIAGGAAAIAVSLVFGGVARSDWKNAMQHCSALVCDAAGVQSAHSAAAWGNASTGMFLFGSGAAAAGVISLLTAASAREELARPDNPRAIRVIPRIGSAQAVLTLEGGF
jgi:hypothetical protein